MFSLSIYIPSFLKNWKPVPPHFICMLHTNFGGKQTKKVGGFAWLRAWWFYLTPSFLVETPFCSDPSFQRPLFLLVYIWEKFDVDEISEGWFGDLVRYNYIFFFNIQVEKWAFKMKQKRVFRLNVDHTQRIFFFRENGHWTAKVVVIRALRTLQRHHQEIPAGCFGLNVMAQIFFGVKKHLEQSWKKGAWRYLYTWTIFWWWPQKQFSNCPNTTVRDSFKLEVKINTKKVHSAAYLGGKSYIIPGFSLYFPRRKIEGVPREIKAIKRSWA